MLDRQALRQAAAREDSHEVARRLAPGSGPGRPGSAVHTPGRGRPATGSARRGFPGRACRPRPDTSWRSPPPIPSTAWACGSPRMARQVSTTASSAPLRRMTRPTSVSQSSLPGSKRAIGIGGHRADQMRHDARRPLRTQRVQGFGDEVVHRARRGRPYKRTVVAIPDDIVVVVLQVRQGVDQRRLRPPACRFAPGLRRRLRRGTGWPSAGRCVRLSVSASSGTAAASCRYPSERVAACSVRGFASGERIEPGPVAAMRFFAPLRERIVFAFPADVLSQGRAGGCAADVPQGYGRAPNHVAVGIVQRSTSSCSIAVPGVTAEPCPPRALPDRPVRSTAANPSNASRARSGSPGPRPPPGRRAGPDRPARPAAAARTRACRRSPMPWPQPRAPRGCRRASVRPGRRCGSAVAEDGQPLGGGGLAARHRRCSAARPSSHFLGAGGQRVGRLAVPVDARPLRGSGRTAIPSGRSRRHCCRGSDAVAPAPAASAAAPAAPGPSRLRQRGAAWRG